MHNAQFGRQNFKFREKMRIFPPIREGIIPWRAAQRGGIEPRFSLCKINKCMLLKDTCFSLAHKNAKKQLTQTHFGVSIWKIESLR